MTHATLTQNIVRPATGQGDSSSVFTDVPQKTPHAALGVPIGINDRTGRPIHTGDTLSFDPAEWGGECVFVVELTKGQIRHPGATQDLNEWCEIVRAWDSNAKPKPIRSYVKLDGKSRESKVLSVLDKAIRFRTSIRSAISTAELDSTLREHGYVVMSISTRLSRLRTTWKAMGVGNLNRVDTIAPDKKRICSYWLDKRREGPK